MVADPTTHFGGRKNKVTRQGIARPSWIAVVGTAGSSNNPRVSPPAPTIRGYKPKSQLLLIDYNLSIYSLIFSGFLIHFLQTGGILDHTLPILKRPTQVSKKALLWCYDAANVIQCYKVLSPVCLPPNKQKWGTETKLEGKEKYCNEDK